MSDLVIEPLPIIWYFIYKLSQHQWYLLRYLERHKQSATTKKGFVSAERFKKFVAAFIDFKKLIFALVNGPAVGIMVTILGLCDVVYVTDDATFVTPFSKLGQSPEGCSTYIYPRLVTAKVAQI